MGLADVLSSHRVVVCVGSGGVGKTTTSAAIAIAAARQGRRCAVLTIDPAKRLAQALGIEKMGNEPRALPSELVGPGSVDAMMLETAAAFDDLISRLVPEPSRRDRLLENRLYQVIARHLGGTHEYMAVERLYALTTEGNYDLVVLDTPPARNALDILDAPHQLARFLDARFVEWFLPQARERGLRDRILAAGGDVAKKLLGMITGEKLLTEIVEFLDAFASLREGFVQRAERVDRILRAPTSGFVLVSSASPASADDAAWLRHDLERRKVPIDAVIFNQSFIPLDPRHPLERRTSLGAGSPEWAWQRLAPHLSEPKPVPELLAALRELRVEAAGENARLQEIIAGVEAELDPACTRVQIPRFDDEIRDLEGLAVLADALVAERPR